MNKKIVQKNKLITGATLRSLLLAIIIIAAFGGLGLWLNNATHAATSGKTVLYLHKERAASNQTYNALTLTPPEPATDSATTTNSTTTVTTPPTALCNSNGNTGDVYNVITADGTVVGIKCLASFISMPVGQSFTVSTSDTTSIGYNFWFDVGNSKITANPNLYFYQLSGATLTPFASLTGASTSSTTPLQYSASITPSSTVTFAATDRIVVIAVANVTVKNSTGQGNIVSFFFDSTARAASQVNIKYSLTAPNKPTLTGSMDDDFTTAAATTACSTAGVTYNTKWTCLQGSAASTAGGYNAEDAAASGGGDSSNWLWLKNQVTANTATVSNFGTTPSNTFLYQSLPSAYGNGNVRTVLNSTNTYQVDSGSVGGSSPYSHSGLVLWTSNTDYLELQVYSTSNSGNGTGGFTNSVDVALNNSGTLSGITSLNPTTTSGLYNRVWLGFTNTNGSWQAQYSTDGTTWNNVGSPVSHAVFNRAGLNEFSAVPTTVNTYAGAFDWFQSTLATPTYNQISYRWFANADSTVPGSPFAAQNTPYMLTSAGQQFRLRTLLKETGQTAISGDNFRLQYAQQKGTCAASTYGDVPPDTGPIGGSSAVNDSTVGTLAWTNPSYALTSDGRGASVNNATTSTSYYLDVTGFGFALPANATVSGIVVNTTASSSGTGTAADGSVKIVQGGALAGTDHTQGAISSATYGNSTDLWGLTWTPAQINASNFGVGISINISGNAGFNLDYVSITVYFSVPNSLAFYNNLTPASGANITTTANDPTDGTQTVAAETYQETNSFTNAQAAMGNTVDGEWDFSLYDNGSLSGTTYCFRVVKSDGTALNTYTNYPTITTVPTIDQFMRGGMWFSRDDNKQSYYWAQ